MLPDPLHPAVVHLPIALAVVIPLLAVLGTLLIHGGFLPPRTWAIAVLLQGLLVGSGWLALETGEEEEERVEEIVAERHIESHEDAAERFVWLAAAGLVTCAVGLLPRRAGALGRVATSLIALGVLVAGVYVGHSGGELVYRYGAASAYVERPSELRNLERRLIAPGRIARCMLFDALVAASLFGLLFASLEFGFRSGRRTRQEGDPDAGAQVGAIQGAVLGLLGLLLAFSFAAAGSRFLERQDLIVTEANAIGTAFLRADLLDEPHRSELRAALQRYTEHRVALSARLHRGVAPADFAEIERLHARIWSAAAAGVAARPAAMLAVLAPVNEVIDLHAVRLAAGRKHLPFLVLGLLVACSAIAVGVIGYGCGMGGRRRIPLTAALAILIGTGLWITIDLDHPRGGLIYLSDAPLQALRFDTPGP